MLTPAASPPTPGCTKKNVCACVCTVPQFGYDVVFFRYCKLGALQFCIIKPLFALIAIIAYVEVPAAWD